MHFLPFPAMCDPGHSYSNSSCEPCGRGYYQSLPGQTYCNPCDLGRVTRLENSTSCYDCIGEDLFVYMT